MVKKIDGTYPGRSPLPAKMDGSADVLSMEEAGGRLDKLDVRQPASSWLAAYRCRPSILLADRHPVTAPH
jgi:hypothetical protein